MEHRTILGGGRFLPFARSRITALRAIGVQAASQKFEIDGTSIKVRIVGEHEFIHIEEKQNAVTVFPDVCYPETDTSASDAYNSVLTVGTVPDTTTPSDFYTLGNTVYQSKAGRLSGSNPFSTQRITFTDTVEYLDGFYHLWSTSVFWNGMLYEEVRERSGGPTSPPGTPYTLDDGQTFPVGVPNSSDRGVAALMQRTGTVSVLDGRVTGGGAGGIYFDVGTSNIDTSGVQHGFVYIANKDASGADLCSKVNLADEAYTKFDTTSTALSGPSGYTKTDTTLLGYTNYSVGAGMACASAGGKVFAVRKFGSIRDETVIVGEYYPSPTTVSHIRTQVASGVLRLSLVSGITPANNILEIACGVNGEIVGVAPTVGGGALYLLYWLHDQSVTMPDSWGNELIGNSRALTMAKIVVSATDTGFTAAVAEQKTFPDSAGLSGMVATRGGLIWAQNRVYNFSTNTVANLPVTKNFPVGYIATERKKATYFRPQYSPATIAAYASATTLSYPVYSGSVFAYVAEVDEAGIITITEGTTSAGSLIDGTILQAPELDGASLQFKK